MALLIVEHKNSGLRQDARHMLLFFPHAFECVIGTITCVQTGESQLRVLPSAEETDEELAISDPERTTSVESAHRVIESPGLSEAVRIVDLGDPDCEALNLDIDISVSWHAFPGIEDPECRRCHGC